MARHRLEVYVAPEEWERLRFVAYQRRLSISALVRAALTEWLGRQKPRPARRGK